MRNKEITKLLLRLSMYLFMEDVSFKPQAMERAALALGELQEDVEDLYNRKGLKGLEEIPGIGRGIAQRIEEYLRTGEIKELELFQKKMPVNIEELTGVEGIGPKMVKALWGKLKIKDIRDLEKAAKAGKIRKLPGFGEKTEQNILQGIAFLQRSKGRWLLGDIYPFVQEYISRLKDSRLVKEAVPAGSVRRMKETIGDIDILATSLKPEKAMEFFLEMVPHEKIWAKGPTKTSLHSIYGFDIDIRVLPEEIFGAALQYFTGSKEHNVKVRTYAAKKGLKLSEYGLFRGKKLIACKTEKEVYKALGMEYPEPELREDQGEVEASLAGKLPKVISYDSLKGDLQTQTNWTDGSHSIEEMAREAKRQGLEYIAITDHTRDLAMAKGCDEKKLMAQMAAIDKAQKKISGIKILKGAEVNIRKDGSLDIEDKVLSRLDVVGIAVHSSFKMTKKDMTERILRAMRNPYADILFHPTGRLLFKREAYELDMDAVIKEAKKTGTVLEINAFPERLDLKDTDIRKAKEGGAKMAINTDAHSKDHLGLLKFGIAQAKRGWAEKEDIINTQSLDKLLQSLKDKRD